MKRFLLLWIFLIMGCVQLGKKHINLESPSRIPANQLNLEYQTGQINGETFQFLRMEGVEYPERVIESDHLFLVVHSSDMTDPRRLLRTRIEELSQLATKLEWDQLQLAMSAEVSHGDPGDYPLPTSSVFPFEGDSHRISFKGKSIVIAGGNLTRCLCTALQSAILLANLGDTNPKKLTVYLPTDAIYEGFFNDPTAQDAEQRVLTNLIDSLDDTAFLNFVNSRFLNENLKFCPDYLPMEFLTNESRELKIDIYRNNNLISSRGSDGFEVQLVFTSVGDIQRRFSNGLEK